MAQQAAAGAARFMFPSHLRVLHVRPVVHELLLKLNPSDSSFLHGTQDFGFDPLYLGADSDKLKW